MYSTTKILNETITSSYMNKRTPSNELPVCWIVVCKLFNYVNLFSSQNAVSRYRAQL